MSSDAPDPEMIVVPSGENATEWTVDVCPSSVEIRRPVLVSHSLTVPSSDNEASIVPSGKNATE